MASLKRPVADRPHKKRFGKRIDRLGAHPVQTDAELEYIVVIFGARIDNRDALHDLSQRDAPAVIPNKNKPVILGFDVDPLAVAHDVLIHGVIDHFLDQDINSIVGMAAISQPTDVHAGSESNMFNRGKALNFAFIINGLTTGHRTILICDIRSANHRR